MSLCSGCQTQEKIVAASAKKFVVIADHSKGSDYLGQKARSAKTLHYTSPIMKLHVVCVACLTFIESELSVMCLLVAAWHTD